MVLLDLSKHVFRSSVIADVIADAVEFFEDTPLHTLPPAVRFAGTGVYALYYVSSEGIYGRLGQLYGEGRQVPIYVGQASSGGVRQGRARRIDSTGRYLWSRLGQHSRSVEQANNLNTDEFRSRFMVMTGIEHGLIRTVESALIAKYKPLWNSYVDGFGIHDPGAGRTMQEVSEWDSIHPGRTFVNKLQSSARQTQPILDKIANALQQL